jgi:hypothetical protein
MMKFHRKFPTVVALCSLILVLTTTPAYAYVDPNAAGLIPQIITPLLITAAAAATFLRRQIGAAFGAVIRRFRRQTDA